MSLRSKKEILSDAAEESREGLLMAALQESQERYELNTGKILKALKDFNSRLNVLEGAVMASNEKKTVDLKKTLEKASEAVMGDITANMGKFNAEIRESTHELQTAKKEAKKKAAQEELKSLLMEFVVVVAAFYVALVLYGWWYDIPEAVKGITNHNTMLEAINNGIYQLLNR